MRNAYERRSDAARRRRAGWNLPIWTWGILLLILGTAGHAVVRFEVVDAQGDPLPGQTVTIIFPDGSEEEREADERGLVILPGDAPGRYVARYVHEGRSLSATGQVTPNSTAAGGGSGLPAWAVPVGLVAGAAAVVVATDDGSGNSDSGSSSAPPPSDSGSSDGGDDSGGGDGGSGDGGSGGSGGASGDPATSDTKVCQLDVDETAVSNPDMVTEPFGDGDPVEVTGDLDASTLSFDFNLMNFSGAVTLPCSVSVDSGLEGCDGSGSFTFNGSSVTATFTGATAAIDTSGATAELMGTSAAEINIGNLTTNFIAVVCE